MADQLWLMTRIREEEDRHGWSDVDEIQQPHADSLGDYGELVENEIGSKLLIWRTFVFQTGSSYISAVN